MLHYVMALVAFQPCWGGQHNAKVAYQQVEQGAKEQGNHRASKRDYIIRHAEVRSRQAN